MNIIKYLATLFFVGLIFVSCTIKPAKINYGDDHCHYCDMTIVNKSFISEYVTKKGKSYKFDAIECMAHEINQKKNSNDLAYILVANFNNPGELIDVKSATFLISKAIKSPMAAGLSAYKSKKEAKVAQKKYGGNLFTWQKIRTKLGVK